MNTLHMMSSVLIRATVTVTSLLQTVHDYHHCLCSRKCDRKVQSFFLICLGSVTPYRMDKDLTTKNLYYTVFGHSSHIGVLTPSGTNILLRKTRPGEYLRDIVVHPGNGYEITFCCYYLNKLTKVN